MVIRLKIKSLKRKLMRRKRLRRRMKKMNSRISMTFKREGIKMKMNMI